MKRIFPLILILSAAIACGPALDGPGGADGPDTGNPEEPQFKYFYQEVAESREDWSGDYLIAYKDVNDIKVFADWDDQKYGQHASGVDLAAQMTGNGIPAEDVDAYKSTFTKVGEYYSINVSNVGFIGHDPSTKNTLLASDNTPDASEKEYLWTISIQSDIWLRLAYETNRRLQWNISGSPRFSTYTGGQGELTLYRKVAISDNGDITDPDNPGGGDIEEPDKPVDPDEPGNKPDIDEGGNTNGYLVNYEIPHVDVNLEAGVPYSSFVSETKGGPAKAFIYEPAKSGQRIVTHTFSDRGKTSRNYSFLYDYDKLCPIWLAYHMNKDIFPLTGTRTDDWGYDPAIPENNQPNLKKTYGSGYNRGHMLASHSRTRAKDTNANRQTFYYTNMTPQHTDYFNNGQGVWNALEEAEERITPSGMDTLYVVTGSIFEKGYKTITSNLGDECAVPTHFYKCFILCSFDNNGKVTSAKGNGFYMPHHTTAGEATKDYNKFSKTIDEIEGVIGYDLFANIPEEWQSKAESEKGLRL